MTTTEHTQTLAQTLKTADKTEMPSKETFQQILEEFGSETMTCITWRASLRVLPLIAFKPLEKVWPESTVKHSVAVIRVNIFLHNLVRKNPYGSMDFLGAAYAAAAADADADADADAAAYAAYAAAYAADAADAAYVAADVAADAAAYAAAAYAAAAADSKPLIDNVWADIIALTQRITIEALFQRDLWQQVPAFFEDYKQKLHEELTLHNLDFFWQDLESLWQGEFLNPDRFARYAENLTEDVLSDAEQLRQVIEGDVDTQANSAVRVLLLGPGGAGKTTLAKRLKKESTDRPSASTISIEHGRLKLDGHMDVLNGLTNHEGDQFKPTDLQLFLWDFGGQTIFHNLHRGFMRRENCVYVLVVDSRHEQSADQWLQQLQFHLQGDDSLPKNTSPEHASPTRNVPLATVFLITNEYELVTRQQNQRRLLREFPRLLTEHSFINLSCFFDENWEGDKKTEEKQRLEGFLKRLVEQCVKSQHVLVKENAQTIQLLNDGFNGKDTWRKSEIIQRLQDKQLASSKADAQQRINKMQDLGQLIQLGDGVDYCINPAWLSSVAYELINSEALKSNRGVASADLIDQRHGELGDKLMRFLVENHVAAPLGENGQAPYFFPDAASENEPATVQSLIADHHWQIHYELDFLPLGFRSQLLTRLLNDNIREFMLNITPDSASEVWREGFIAHHQHKTAQMLVQYDTDLRRIAVYLCADNAQEVDAFASMLNSLHNALARVIKPHTKQPRIITSLKTEKKHPNDSNQQAYFALAEELRGYDIFIEAVKKRVIGKSELLTGFEKLNEGQRQRAVRYEEFTKQRDEENSKETKAEGERNRRFAKIEGVLNRRTSIKVVLISVFLSSLTTYILTTYSSNNTTDPTNKNQSIIAPEPNNKSVSETHINNTITPIKTAQPESKNEAQTDTKKVTTADNNKVAPTTTKKPELIENTRENTPATKKVLAAESIKQNLVEGKQAASDENSSKNVP